MAGKTSHQAENKVGGMKRATNSRAALLVTKPQRKASPKRKRRMLNGIPLKRKAMWIYDANSPEFKAQVKAQAREIKAQVPIETGSNSSKWCSPTRIFRSGGDEAGRFTRCPPWPA